MFQAERREEPKQTDRKPEKCFNRHAEFLSGRVEVRSRRQDEVPFWGLSYRLSVVRPGSAIEGAETGSQVSDKWEGMKATNF